MASTARELAAPLLGVAHRVPGSEVHSCVTCHSSVNGTYERCYQCNEASWLLGGQYPLVLPITLSAERSQMHHVLREYKDSLDPTVRARFVLQLAAFTAVFLQAHSRCLGEFDVVTCVPSRIRTAFEPVVQRLKLFRDAYQPLLTVTSDEGSHVLSRERFTASAAAHGRTVLIVDDTFTSGASVFSATHALRAGGGTVNAILVVGRHINPNYGPSAKMLEDMQNTPWVESECVVCRPAVTLF